MNPPLTTFADLRAEDFVDTAVSPQSQPVAVTVKGVDLVTLQIYPVMPDSSKYLVRSSASPQVFLINKYVAQQIFKPLESHDVLHKTGAAPIAVTPPEREPVVPLTTPSKPDQKPVISQAGAEEKKQTGKTTSAPPLSFGKKTRPASPTKTGITEKSAGAEKSQPLITEKKPSTVPPKTLDLTGAKKAPPLTGRETKPTVSPVNVPPVTERKTDSAGAVTPATQTSKPPATETKQRQTSTGDDEGELTVYTVKAGETMPIIAKKFNCTVEEILKWNLLKSITVKPGQELYIYVKK